MSKEATGTLMDFRGGSPMVDDTSPTCRAALTRAELQDLLLGDDPPKDLRTENREQLVALRWLALRSKAVDQLRELIRLTGELEDAPSPSAALLQVVARAARDEELQRLEDMVVHLAVTEPGGAVTKLTFLVTDHKARVEQGYCGPGKRWEKAEHAMGVAYLCPWEDPFGGFPEHSRRCARALSKTGLPVHLRGIDPGRQIHMMATAAGKAMQSIKDEYQDLLSASIRHILVEVHQLVPEDEYLHRLTLHRFMTPEQLAEVNRYRIVYTVWERDRVPEHVVRCLNAVGQCWVANPHDLEMLARSGVDREKLRVVPIPYRPDDPHLALRGRRRVPGPPRLYHIGKWEPRKAQHEMIGAFMMAFKPGEARLFLKTSAQSPEMEGYPRTAAVSAHQWLQDERIMAQGWTSQLFNGDVFLIQEHVSEEKLLQLHRMGDIYLTLSRGEGFDMCAGDAKLSGNLMVYTPSGGPQSFAHEDDVRVEPSGMVDCHPIYRWKGAQYLDYRVEDAAKAMRDAVRRIGLGIRGDVDLRDFTMESVGKRMRGYIEELAEKAKEI